MELGSQSINEFLDALAAKQPTPGGGAVAGVLVALSTSLGNMVLGYSLGKETLKEHAALHDASSVTLLSACKEAIELAHADATAYEALNAMFTTPRDDPDAIENWNRVVLEAISVPIRTMELCQNVLVTLQSLVGKSNRMLSSDLAIAAILADAAARSANWNVQINLSQLSNDDERDGCSKQADELLSTCKGLAESIETSCKL